METEKLRPVTVRMEQFRQELNQAVEHSELPAYLLEILMGQYLEGVSRVAQREYAQDKEEWEKQQSKRVQPEKNRGGKVYHG